MKIASHNSFTYFPVRKWWMKPLAFTARCQRVDYHNQYVVGARMFDFRVRFDKENNNQPVICHGLIEYDASPSDIEKIFTFINRKKNCYVRVALETTKPDAYQEEQFRKWCEYMCKTYPNVKFFGGNNRTDWLCENPIYKFETPMQEIDNKYASSTTRFDSDSVILRYIDDLYPYDYAKKYNHKIIENGTTFQWLMIDFVDIQ